MAIKEYMHKDEIKKYILSGYPYIVDEIIPVKFKDTDKQRAVYKIVTDHGPKCLKKVYYGEADLLFVYSVIEWFCLSGIRVPRLLPTKTGGRFVKHNNNLFILTEWIDGRKCDYDQDDDVAAAAENLGRMHKTSYGFTPITGSAKRMEESNWYKTFNRRFLQLLQFNNKSLKSSDRFSRTFSDSFEYYIKRAEHAINILNSIDFEELTAPALKHNTICHLDYVNKNLIVTDSDDLYVIDFDKCKTDIPVHDIGTFLKRILKRKTTSWDYNILMLTLNSYEKERVLTMTEILALFAFLEFPQKYWKISRDYYNNRKGLNKKLSVSMLSKACSQKEDHNDFCNKFQMYIEERFNISLNR